MLVRLRNGTGSVKKHTEITETTAVINAFNISEPTQEISGFGQHFLARAIVGNCQLIGATSELISTGRGVKLVDIIERSKR